MTATDQQFQETDSPVQSSERTKLAQKLHEVFFKGAMVNTAKIEERASLLNEHPDLRKRINLIDLDKIIPFTDFIVDPNCSLARDQVIEGSDVDGGLVVTAIQSTQEQQSEFVRKLREQGFKVYHPAEIKSAEEKWFEAEEKKDEIPASEYKLVFDRYQEMVGKRIEFILKSEIEEQVANQVESKVVATYLNGANLGQVYLKI